MTNQEINERVASITGFHDKVGLKKRGYWYRPGGAGYTNREEEAGRYTIAEAQEHAYPYGEPVTIHKFTTPNYAESLDACGSFEGSITDCDVGLYEYWLGEITQSDAMALRRCFVGERMKLIRATPLQRCEAFLRLKGQWDEN